LPRHLTLVGWSDTSTLSFAVNLYENFVDEESIAVASVFSAQFSDVYSAEFDAPEMN
jgi:hypothetical protein